VLLQGRGGCGGHGYALVGSSTPSPTKPDMRCYDNSLDRSTEEFPKISTDMQSSELAATYAALILADEGIEITVSLIPFRRVGDASGSLRRIADVGQMAIWRMVTVVMQEWRR
jgi:hypothetical protein